MDDKIKIDLSVSDETTETKKIHKQIHGRIKKAAYTHRDCRRRDNAFLIPFRWVLGWALSNYLGETNLKNAKALPLGISVIYFSNKSKNIYADLPPDKEQAKRLSKRIYKDAMTAVCTEQADGKALAPACD